MDVTPINIDFIKRNVLHPNDKKEKAFGNKLLTNGAFTLAEAKDAANELIAQGFEVKNIQRSGTGDSFGPGRRVTVTVVPKETDSFGLYHRYRSTDHLKNKKTGNSLIRLKPRPFSWLLSNG